MLRKLKTLSRRWTRECDGPTSVEYAVMLALMIVVMVSAISLLGQGTAGRFQTIHSTLF